MNINSENTKKSSLILMVDDVAKNLQILGTLLKSHPCSLAAATNGPQALKIAKEALPDLILLDIMMPGMDGYEVCERLKGDERTRDIPVIFISARNEYEDVVRGFQCGAVDYVAKPFNSMELLARVRTHLRLKSLQTQLSEANRAKEKLLSLISHDLRGGVAQMTSFIRLMKTSMNTLSDDEIQTMMSELEIKSQNTYGYLTNILEWSRFQKDHIVPNASWFSLSELTDEIQSTLHEMASAKEIALEFKVQEPIEIYADRTMISIVLYNLINNAIKFSRQNGQVEIVSELKGTQCRFAVIDSGIGMDENLQKKILNHEEISSSMGTDGEKGSGIGLQLVLEFIALNGGRLSLASRIDQGTTFEFYLKARKE